MRRIIGNQSSKEKRHPLDLYSTDPSWTRVLLREQILINPIWEPASGEGKMSEVLEEVYDVFSSDVSTGEDFLTSKRRSNSIVTNPPYRLLDEFIKHGLEQTNQYLCLLIGWHFISGGVKRSSNIWVPHPPNRVIVIPERMKVNGKTSQFNHAWVVWDVTKPSPATSLEWRSICTVIY